MFKQTVDRLISLGSTVQRRGLASVSDVLPHAKTPPSYVLTQLRSFPSLEPESFQPVASQILHLPVRKDLLWKAVVYEADGSRVGSSNPPGRSDKGYSRKKLRPQKGSGRARMGDRGSPTRHDGGRALARRAPVDFSTELPAKVYDLAMRTALSYHYRRGTLFVLNGDKADFEIPHEIAGETFLDVHGLRKLNLLFIVAGPRPNLHEATMRSKARIDIVEQEETEVRDVLRANRVFVELEALKMFSEPV